MDDFLTEAADRVRRATREIRRIRADRWLAAWPPRHPERPPVPRWVQDIIDERNTTDAVQPWH